MVLEFIHGLTEDNIKGIGKIIKWMEMVCSHGLMAENMKENIAMIKNKVKEYFRGLIKDSIKEIGKMGNSMGKVLI